MNYSDEKYKMAIKPAHHSDSVLDGVDVAMLNGKQLCDAMQLLANYHSAFITAVLTDDVALNDVLEQARSNILYQNFSAFITAICDYSALYNSEQRQIINAFLVDSLVHQDLNIRHQVAAALACLMLSSNPNDRAAFANLVNQNIDHFLSADVTVSELHSSWLGDALASFIDALITNCPAEQQAYCLEIVLAAIERFRPQPSSYPYLLSVIQILPLDLCSAANARTLCQIVKNIAITGDSELKIEAQYTCHYLLTKFDSKLLNEILTSLEQTDFPIIEQYFKAGHDRKAALNHLPDVNIGTMFLSNLKAATPSIVKLVQIDILVQLIDRAAADAFYTAMHFSNLLKTSSDGRVRRRAAEALQSTIKRLTNGQKNDIAIELLLALEVQSYRFSKQIPAVLGNLLTELAASEFADIIADFVKKVKGDDQKIAILIIDSAMYCLNALLTEQEKIDADKMQSLLKVAFNGLFHHDIEITRHAIRALGRPLFAGAVSYANQSLLFVKIAKKLLVAIAREDDDYFAHLSKALTLNQIQQFIKHTDAAALAEELAADKKVAFFPGTYDPFSKAHLKSATMIRDLGFEVYLAIDEFSWSKRTQPNRTRRKIVEMSIADEADIYVFPQNIIVNIANKDDLLALKKMFDGRQVYLVMGSDVLINASAYRRTNTKNVLSSFSHIVFERAVAGQPVDDQTLQTVLSRIKGDVIRLSLTPEVELISSTQIRNDIDLERDISDLMEKMSQQYIYDKALYRHEPLFKDTLTVRSTGVSVTEKIDESLIAEIVNQFSIKETQIRQLLADNKSDQPMRLLQIRAIEQNNKLIAFALFHWLRSGMIYHEFPSDKISYYIRNNAVGRIVVLDALVCQPNSPISNIEQVVLTEALAFSLAKDYTYAIYKNAFQRDDRLIDRILKLQGFISYCDDDGNCIKAVDMSDPIILNLDCKSMIKAPYRDAPGISAAIGTARQKLQEALCRFKRGSLVLSFDRSMMYEHLIKKICDVNQVPTYQIEPRRLGDNMCVTYGDLFKRWRIPNTVTKALHTERFYHSDFQSYDVQNAPDYLDLDIQTRTIKSFQRPVILVDDIFDKGYRLRGIMSTFNTHQVNVKKLVAAILTGRGKAWLEMNDIAVEWAYYIPKVKFWFNESMLYPFIGGDAVEGQLLRDSAPLQSINLILPYVFPRFLRAVPKDKIADFSRSCLESAMVVLGALEEEYLKLSGRGLTLKDINAVLVSARLPQQRNYLDYDMKRSPVDVLRADAAYLAKIINYYEVDDEK